MIVRDSETGPGISDQAKAMPPSMNLFVAFVLASCLLATNTRAAEPPVAFPRIIGMNIGNPLDYDDPEYQRELARPHVVILGFWPGWKTERYGPNAIAKTVTAIRRHNPSLLVGQYTILQEAHNPVDRRLPYGDIASKLDANGWWLLEAGGDRPRWTEGQTTWGVNISAWSRPDETGSRFPQWLARYNYRTYFDWHPGFDIWYVDNTLSRSPAKWADWKLDGHNIASDAPDVAAAYREGHVAYWYAAQDLVRRPTIFLANTDSVASAEYRGRFGGAFLEALIGLRWSTETGEGWARMMARYVETLDSVTEPRIVGFNVWGRLDDYRQMRFGLASCLLGNGYFSFTDSEKGYTSVPWFDEYEIDLGTPLHATPVTPWRGTVFRRDFTKGIVLVNPSARPATVQVEPGLQRFAGRQAPGVNTGEPVASLRLDGRDGIILLRIK